MAGSDKENHAVNKPAVDKPLIVPNTASSSSSVVTLSQSAAGPAAVSQPVISASRSTAVTGSTSLLSGNSAAADFFSGITRFAQALETRKLLRGN